MLSRVHVSARADYAVRALLRLAELGDGPVTTEALAAAQALPQRYLESVLTDLRKAGLVRSQRGPDGGYWLTRAAEEITVADVLRAVDGPLSTVRGQWPEDLDYDGVAEPLQHVWIALRSSLRAVLEGVTIAQVAAGELPDFVDELTADPATWRTRR